MPGRYRSLVRFVLGLLSLLPLAPSHIGSGDSVQPRNTESVIQSVIPALPDGVRVDIIGADTFVRLRTTNHSVEIPGYEGEPYLRFENNGEVFINETSPTTALNDDRFGNVDMSGFVKDAPTKWRRVATNGTAMWHDHRVHWMSPKPPAPIDAAGTVLTWNVPVVVDGVATVVSGTLYLRDQASIAWWVFGVLSLLAAVALTMVKKRILQLVLLVISLVGVVVGTLQLLGLPDGARITPLLLMFSAAAALICTAALFAGRRTDAPQYSSLAFQAGVGATFAVCAWLCFDQVRAAYVPGVGQMWMVRSLVPIMLGMGLVAAIDGVTRVVRDSAVSSD